MTLKVTRNFKTELAIKHTVVAFKLLEIKVRVQLTVEPLSKGHFGDVLLQ